MEKDEKCPGELSSFSVCRAENGFKVCCCYAEKDSLSKRAGWIPTSMCSKDYVEKNEICCN